MGVAGAASLALALAVSSACSSGGVADAGDFDPRAHEYAPLAAAGGRGAIAGALIVPGGAAHGASAAAEVTAFPLDERGHDFARPASGRVEGTRYTIDDLAPGHYGVRASAAASGDRRWVADVEVRGGQTRLLDLALVPGRPVHLSIEGALPGDVLTWRVRTDGGTWIPHHVLTGGDPDQAAPLDASFRLVPGEYLFEVDRGRRRRTYEAVRVVPGEDEQEIVLPPR